MIKISNVSPKPEIHYLDEMLAKAKVWIKDIQKEVGLESQTQAFTCLAAVLHTLRDRLSVEEVADFGAQLPTLIRGVYYQGWRPTHALPIRSAAEFVGHVSQQFRHGRIPGGYDPIALVQGVMNVLERRVSNGEMNNIKALMPQDILKLWAKAEAFGGEQPSAVERPELDETSLEQDLEAESSWKEDEPYNKIKGDVMAWDQPD